MTTERDMLDALARRYDHLAGNAQRWIRAEHVRNGTGFMGYDDRTGRCVGPLRTVDFVAVDTWESKGHQIHGHEVKVSRSDWLRELAEPEKAAAWMRYCHRWWLVVPDPAIVRRAELPEGWGVIALQRTTLRAIIPAPTRTPDPLPPPIWISLLRSAQTTAERATARRHAATTP